MQDVVCSRARSPAPALQPRFHSSAPTPLLSDSSWNLSPAFLWLRLTTEVATGEYRGYGRAGTDDEGMMDVA